MGGLSNLFFSLGGVADADANIKNSVNLYDDSPIQAYVKVEHSTL